MFGNNDISIKLNGCKLVPTNHVKYLGLYLDKNPFMEFPCETIK